ncbi:AraC family transcriptional regulator [Escherichia coli]|nr:AraC family transcriptional regulator [Escherichia coli]MDN7385935.1 AraC family transcriptional regulator [Escherichia coli]
MFIHKICLKINLYQYTVVYTKNCVITLIDEKRNETIILPKGRIALLERGLKVFLHIDKISEEIPYEIISLGNNVLREVIRIFGAPKNIKVNPRKTSRGVYDKVFIINERKINRYLFESIKFKSGYNNGIYELACLLSGVENTDGLYNSLHVSVSDFFTDKIRAIIEQDLTKKWKLSLISEELNMAEVSVRKRLDAEGINFHQVLLDVRMQEAVRLILNGTHHINKISSLIGISSTSYFIRIFSNYYGVTPKQFYLYHKSTK